MSKRILLLHPEDAFPHSPRGCDWDLVVDLGRAPRATYEHWRQEAGCEVLSIYQLAREVEDLQGLRQLLKLGLGKLVDQTGIDWWDQLCLFVASDVQQLVLIHRLSKQLGTNSQLYSSRRDPLPSALQEILKTSVTILEGKAQAAIRRLRHYERAFWSLDTTQLVQVLEDKVGVSRLMQVSRRRRASNRPVVLLPSAYANVSRAALGYARMLPDQQFLLVHTRRSGKIKDLPSNVRMMSLGSYFRPSDNREVASLLQSWSALRMHLTREAEEFDSADAIGILRKIPDLLPWGIALRNAWTQLFESEHVIGCLSADDSNPPSSIPLLMAKQHGLPALACHHGALDYQMAIKENHADFYLAKGEMEQNYLQQVCGLNAKRILIAASSQPTLPARARSSAPWLVFFTEPYQYSGWRSDELYRDLMPRLCALAQSCNLKLVFKLHPFENIKGHRRMLRRLIAERESEIGVIAGRPSDELWAKTSFALTVQSSTALECVARGIPVFLCSWLRDSYSGYVQQFARFGVGRVLESPEQIDDIPRLLSEANGSPEQPASRQRQDSARLAELFAGNGSVSQVRRNNVHLGHSEPECNSVLTLR